MANGSLTRFLGGSPLAVLVRLLFVSLIVGALLAWLDIHPRDIFSGLERFIRRFTNMGFAAVREVGGYILIGAMIVVPVWLVMRLLNIRGSN